MNCPKCNTLLLRRRFSRREEYFCIGCALEGTYLQIVGQAKKIKERLEREEKERRNVKRNN